MYIKGKISQDKPNVSIANISIIAPHKISPLNNGTKTPKNKVAQEKPVGAFTKKLLLECFNVIIILYFISCIAKKKSFYNTICIFYEKNYTFTK